MISIAIMIIVFLMIVLWTFKNWHNITNKIRLEGLYK